MAKTACKPAQVHIPTSEQLQPDWSIRSYSSSWTESGLVASVELIPIQDRPALGYTLETSLDPERRPGGRLTDRQWEIGEKLLSQLRPRMQEALQQAGWRVVRRTPGKKEIWQHTSSPRAPEPEPATLSSHGQLKTYAVYGSKQAREAAKESGAPPAFTRQVSKSLVTFQCTICGNQVTQWHLPGQKPRYCANGICQREAVRRRVKRSRERKQAMLKSQ